jgi:hypothetical protein
MQLLCALGRPVKAFRRLILTRRTIPTQYGCEKDEATIKMFEIFLQHMRFRLDVIAEECTGCAMADSIIHHRITWGVMGVRDVRSRKDEIDQLSHLRFSTQIELKLIDR